MTTAAAIAEEQSAISLREQALAETLLDVTNALSESISHTHPHAKLVDEAREVLAKHGYSVRCQFCNHPNANDDTGLCAYCETRHYGDEAEEMREEL